MCIRLLLNSYKMVPVNACLFDATSFTQVKELWLETQATAFEHLTNEEWNACRIAVDDTDVAMTGYPLLPSADVTVDTNRQILHFPYVITIHDYCYSSAVGFKDFLITDIVQNWKAGQTNFGVLLRVATNENTSGITLQFVGDEASVGLRAYIEAVCTP